MKRPRRQFLHLAAGAAALPAVPRIDFTQAYPTRPVRIIVGFAPGGGHPSAFALLAKERCDFARRLADFRNRVEMSVRPHQGRALN